MTLHDLETPAVVVDLDVLDRSLARMAAYAREHSLALRPHIKTHKIPALAQRQLASGAVGITCAKLGEARVMAEAGIGDILLAYPIVTPDKARHVAELLETVRLGVVLDSPEAANVLSAAVASSARPLRVLVEYDAGFGRCGVGSPEAAVALGRHVASLPGLALDGLMYYPGHTFVPYEPQTAVIADINARLDAACDAFRAAGLPLHTVSGGSTPTAYRSHESAHLTEIRPGMYLLNDRNLVQGGFARLEDCALSVIATVVSTAVSGKAIIDGGSKTFSSDRLLTGDGRGHGLVLDDPDTIFAAMSEEHGHLDRTGSARPYRVGERLRILPNHVCSTINMHQRIYGVRGETVEEVWTVAARGCVQ